jgi:excisionase family DNA binding protein
MPEVAPDDSLITAHQVAELLGCSLRTVERIQADGGLTPIYLPMKRRARARRFRRADVEAFRASERVSA